MKITAVEWLENRFLETEGNLYSEDFIQAKEMEKEQREKYFVEGYKIRALASNLIFDENSEYYAKTLFNRIFKSE